jgi:hypothetical protein
VALDWVMKLKNTPRDDDLAIWNLHGNIALEIMNRHLAKTQWFATDAFTIASLGKTVFNPSAAPLPRPKSALGHCAA